MILTSTLSVLQALWKQILFNFFCSFTPFRINNNILVSKSYIQSRFRDTLWISNNPFGVKGTQWDSFWFGIIFPLSYTHFKTRKLIIFFTNYKWFPAQRYNFYSSETNYLGHTWSYRLKTTFRIWCLKSWTKYLAKNKEIYQNWTRLKKFDINFYVNFDCNCKKLTSEGLAGH